MKRTEDIFHAREMLKEDREKKKRRAKLKQILRLSKFSEISSETTIQRTGFG